MSFSLPLMENNITAGDRDAVLESGNYPALDEARIRWLCDILNSVHP